MKKTSIFLLGCLSVLPTLTFAQLTYREEKANEYFNKQAYPQAIEQYRYVVDKEDKGNYGSLRNLALSYMYTHDYVNAQKYMGRVMKNENKKPEDVYNYISILKSNKKYEEAEKYISVYNQMDKNDSRIKRHIQNPNIIKEILEDKDRFNVTAIADNSEKADFGPAYFKDKIMFSSSRVTRPVRKVHDRDALPYLNLFVADRSSTDGDLREAKLFDKEVHTDYHEGPVVFDHKTNKLYYTRNNNLEEKKGVKKLEIMVADINQENEVTNTYPFQYNEASYSVGHPALSPDGNTLYFVSDKPGGKGGTDIYKCTKDGEAWTAPENLGENINTEGDEMFPFVDSLGDMFIASDGHPGIGGLDIFYVRNADAEPINLGASLNSNLDDFGFIVDRSGKNGYFSSNRVGGKGNDDIYKFKLLKDFAPTYMVKGAVLEGQTNDTIDVAEVLLKNPNGEVLDSVQTTDGSFEFEIEPDQSYFIVGKKPKYSEVVDLLDTDELSPLHPVLQHDLHLVKGAGGLIKGKVLSKEYETPIEGASVRIYDMNDGGKQLYSFTTPANGQFRTPAKLEAGQVLKYKVDVGAPGYLGKSETVEITVPEDQIVDINSYLDLKLQKIGVGTDLAKIIEINPIYFDLNKHDIRPDAALELDKIVKVMRENPNIVIELGSHTDARGSDGYNFALSGRRARSSAKYIKERIDDANRIYGKGYGETRLVNKCKNGVKCSEEEHQLNRRTEFKIVRM